MILEFLKFRADFKALPGRLKKPFKGQVIDINQQNYNEGAVYGRNCNKQLSKWMISDGFNQIMAVFTKECQQEMEDTYPSCINVHTLDSRVICIKDFEIELKMPFDSIQNIDKNNHGVRNWGPNSGEKGRKSENNAMNQQLCWKNLSLELVLVIKSLKIISYDNTAMQRKIPLTNDDQVQNHLQFILHHKFKEQCLMLIRSQSNLKEGKQV